MKEAFPAGMFGTLFTLSDTAVIGTQNRIIAFMNPAAQRILGCDETGRPVSCLLPQHVIQSQATEFVTAATLVGKHAIITVTSLAAFRLYTLTFDQTDNPPPSPIFAPQLSTLANFRLVTEYFTRYCEDKGDAKLSRYSAELSKCFYLINRWSVNASLLSALQNGTLPFLPVTVDLKQQFSDLLDGVRFFAEKRGIDILLEAPESRMIYTLDPNLIEQMALNIICNSLLHCERGDRVRVTLSASGSSIFIAFNDTGSGIPADKLASIFSSYLPRNRAPAEESGAGFGLAVALGIAERHGGTILAESSEKNGTSIRVLLSASISGSGQLKCDPPAYLMQQNSDLLTGLADFLDASDFQAQLLD